MLLAKPIKHHHAADQTLLKQLVTQLRHLAPCTSEHTQLSFTQLALTEIFREKRDASNILRNAWNILRDAWNILRDAWNILRDASREKLENCRLHTSSKAPRTMVGPKMHKHKKPEEKKGHNMFGNTSLNFYGLSKKHTVWTCFVSRVVCTRFVCPGHCHCHCWFNINSNISHLKWRLLSFVPTYFKGTIWTL